MAYFLADSAGHLCDFATNSGLRDFRLWAEQKPGVIKDFVEKGYTEEPELLFEQLALLKDIPQSAKDLQAAALQARDVLIISNGTSNDEDPAFRAASAKSILAVADKNAQEIALSVEIAQNRAGKVLKLKGVESALLVFEKTLRPLLERDLHEIAEDAVLLTQGEPLRAAARGKKTLTRAQEWAEDYAAELVTNISNTMRKRIRAIIAEKGQDSYEDLLAIIKDPERASLISRTESIRAANEGQFLGWEELIDEGLLSENVEREWITAGDELAQKCPICGPLDGQKVSFNDPFILSDGSLAMVPPGHPRCRCTIGLSNS